MTPALLLALALIFSSLALYSVGVWALVIARRLAWSHVALFWLGLLADALATAQMARIAGGLSVDVHTVTGLLALALMVVHNGAATVVRARGDEHWIGRFHRVSLPVWVLWLIPFLLGLALHGPGG